MKTFYAVALYKNGKFEGRVGASFVTWKDATACAAQWRTSHAYKHQYRAVELADDGSVIRTEFDHNDSL